jgi:hypothetical protein
MVNRRHRQLGFASGEVVIEHPFGRLRLGQQFAQTNAMKSLGPQGGEHGPDQPITGWGLGILRLVLGHSKESIDRSV